MKNLLKIIRPQKSKKEAERLRLTDIEKEGWFPLDRPDGATSGWLYLNHPEVKKVDCNLCMLGEEPIPYNDYELHYDEVSGILMIGDMYRERIYEDICRTLPQFKEVIKTLNIPYGKNKTK